MHLFKKVKSYRAIHIQKVHSCFQTVDGSWHDSYTDIIDTNRINCSCGEYEMNDINDDGYIEDKDGIMYPLGCVISIRWVIEKEKEYKIEDKHHNSNLFDSYQVYYDEEDLKKLEQLSIS